MIKKLSALLIASLSMAGSLHAGIEHLLPKPQVVEARSGHFSSTRIATKGLYLQPEMKALLEEYGLSVDQASAYSLETVMVPSLPKIWFNKEEAYRLTVSDKTIRIEALRPTGLYRGLQTLGQLFASATTAGQIPKCEIYDWPAFRMRGLMHDIGRSYIPLSELKEQIRLLARYKVNVFHWHLTENQAWRLESKLYPQLNAANTMTRLPGKYYTLEEARELAEFCKSLRITLIPELDMPGHSAAFERAMGFGMQTEKGKAVLKVLLQEASAAMDVPYIHIGTDEVEFTDPTFVPEMVAYVRSLGKKVISWNPGWNYKPGEIDMTQLWSYRGKGLLGTPYIDSRLHYINHYDLFSDIVLLYHSQIARVAASNTNVAGSILAVWNDRFISDSKSIMAQNNVYPSMLALAERAWIGGGSGYFDEKTASLDFSAPQVLRAEFVDFERRLLWHKERFFASEPFPYIKQTHAAWYISEMYRNEGQLSRSFAPEDEYLKAMKAGSYTPPSTVGTGELPYTLGTYGSGVYLRHVWGSTCYGLLPQPKENSTVYATAWVHSPKAQQVGLLIETQNYSRSESDLAPPQGQWDYRQSRVWLNGQELKPPTWTSTHQKRDNEIELGNENATARPPMQIALREGWNRILLKLPIGSYTLPEVRLNKWMFTCAITTLDGRHALEGISYATPNITSPASPAP